MAEGPEQGPSDYAVVVNISLQHIESMLGSADHVKGGQANLAALRCVLRFEEMIALVEPAKRVFLAIIGGKQSL